MRRLIINMIAEWLHNHGIPAATGWQLHNCKHGRCHPSIAYVCHIETNDRDFLTSQTGGSVTLNSTDPFTFLNIDPNFFASDFDRFAMVQIVKATRQFVQSPPFKGFIIGPSGAMGEAQTDAEIEEAAKDAVVTIWHPTSTARMSPKNADWGVVDSDLLVKGASGLRIVDASVFVSFLSLIGTQILWADDLFSTANYSCCSHYGTDIHNSRTGRGLD